MSQKEDMIRAQSTYRAPFQICTGALKTRSSKEPLLMKAMQGAASMLESESEVSINANSSKAMMAELTSTFKGIQK